jgi:hypothetical protein
MLVNIWVDERRKKDIEAEKSGRKENRIIMSREQTLGQNDLFDASFLLLSLFH